MNDDDDEAAKPTALISADPIRNFTLTTDERIRALTIGVPAWSERKRHIEDTEVALVKRLVAEHDKLVAKGLPVRPGLEKLAASFQLGKLNDLVKKHNRYYPIEANLALNAKGQYLVYGRVWHPEETFTPERLISAAFAKLEKRSQ